MKLGRAWVVLPALCGFLLSFSFLVGFVVLVFCSCLYLVSGGLVGGVCVSLYVSVCLCVCGRFHLNLALTSLSFRFLPLRYAVKGAFCHNVLSRLSVCILGQCVFSMLLMCGRSVWYSMTNGRFFGVVLDLVVCVRKMSACVRFIYSVKLFNYISIFVAPCKEGCSQSV